MSSRRHPYYDPYPHHGYQDYHYPPAPVAHPSTHHSSAYAPHLPQHVYEPPAPPYASPRSGGTPLVQEVAAEDVKFSVEGGKKRRKAVEVNGVGEDQRVDQSNNYIDDPLYIRQQIMDNAQALMQILCPTAYGPDFAGRYSVVLLQPTPTSKDNAKQHRTHKSTSANQQLEKWRAGVACDGTVVVEGPKAETSFMALNSLLESLAAKLGKVMPRAWDVGEESDGEEETEKTGVVEDEDGARFAVEGGRDKE
ncbi:hypothetical protein LTR78_007847 [Recurvomyces mirabilis]|uniref:Uncharacterized protein n=1 Tax=Recurvomyces mirabilis TaxID=574656 RepID=A0AAE0TRR1_9PEZI|nr:hypothetical protein LTR78_007847 [Recurvomyces mirabilis]KAK5160111.1 hypothetical protein LTS14_002218 [Recurvomyces mirabilis]